jgi:molecular chaperone DnaJ
LDDILGSFGSGFGNSNAQQNPFTKTYSTSQKPAEKNSSVKISFEQAVNGVVVKILGKKVKVPAGVNDGQTIRATINGTIVNIKINIKPDKQYSLSGNNIVMDLPITIAEAALGTTLNIPLYPVGTTKIKVPAGIQNGQLLRVKGKGVPVKNGDLILKVQIKVPQKLTKKQKEAMEIFVKNEKGSPREW